MKQKYIISLLALIIGSGTLVACSKSNHEQAQIKPQSSDTINVDLGSDVPTIDPALTQDVTSARVIYDLFSPLVDFNQNNQPIPGIAQKWSVSKDGKVYTFHLRKGLKFSDGSPITAEDIVFTWQRLADPKVSSPYNILVSNIVNGQAIIDGKAKVETLGVKAIDKQTIQITLEHPDTAFIQICTQPNVGIVSKANLTKFGNQWTNPDHMVTSGAYTIKEWVVQGHMLLTKNPNYYDANNVKIKNVNFLPLVDTNASLSQYDTNGVDITYSIPVDQYKDIQQRLGKQLHQFPLEATSFYDFNMVLPQYANNKNLRQALSMAVDREVIVKHILGQGQTALYSYVTPTIEDGKFAGLEYSWAKLPRAQQLAMAKDLFAKAGYSESHPLEIAISYNTNDGNKKIAIAIAAMWQETFGAQSIKVTQSNQEWKTFLQDRKKADYDIARDGWNADYNSVNTYTMLYYCKSPQNNSKYCNYEYNKLIDKAQNTNNPEERIKLIRQALQLAQDDYAIIPLYQYTWHRLVNPRVKGYDADHNYFDHVQSKWYKF